MTNTNFGAVSEPLCFICGRSRIQNLLSWQRRVDVQNPSRQIPGSRSPLVPSSSTVYSIIQP